MLGLLLLAAIFGLHAIARYNPAPPQYHRIPHPVSTPHIPDLRPPPTPRTSHVFIPIKITPTKNPHLRLPTTLKNGKTVETYYALLPIPISTIKADTSFDDIFPKTDVILIRQDKLLRAKLPSPDEIPRDRLKRAWEDGWLNDIIVNNFFELLTGESNTTTPATAAQAQPNNANTTLSMSSYFLPGDPRISGTTMDDKARNLDTALRKQFPQPNHRPTLLELDTILLPACPGNHWQLVVVRPKDKTIRFYNSDNRPTGDNHNNETLPLNINKLRDLDVSNLTSNSPKIPTGFQLQQLKWAAFIDNLLQHISDKIGHNPPWYRHDEWEVCFSRCPQQLDGSSCGVYTALNAELLLNNYPDDWLHDNHRIPDLMNAYRKRICLAVLNGNL